ncbi:hypothetical protein B296_00030008 [Ensete ventricosum]|uniref:Uncharacterized protein n=1 Tax=Ensete ventricosum TaxID=4639 RepID=A0A426YTX4_ENSVE|nr:hypothetical protein B296_00030008 [Ensete ventricosum]
MATSVRLLPSQPLLVCDRHLCDFCCTRLQRAWALLHAAYARLSTSQPLLVCDRHLCDFCCTQLPLAWALLHVAYARLSTVRSSLLHFPAMVRTRCPK